MRYKDAACGDCVVCRLRQSCEPAEVLGKPQVTGKAAIGGPFELVESTTGQDLHRQGPAGQVGAAVLRLHLLPRHLP